MLTDFLTWEEVLDKLKKEGGFASLEEDYQDEWEFFDLLRKLTNNGGLCIGKSFSKRLKEDVDKYIKLIIQAEEIASKYFGKKNVKLQACYTKIKGSDRVLNINLIDYNRSEPTRISDILQQEKGISELNICCNKKHDIHAYREGKERHYEFKEGAHYEMTSTWPAKDGSGMCTMVMNVSSDGITEVLKFNGEDFVQSEEILGLIKQNDELYIQGLSLYDAVIKSLKKGNAATLPDVNSQSNESIQSKGPGRLKNGTDDGSPPSYTNSNASTQTEVNSQQTETQTGVNLQHTETQTEINSQQTETQTDVNLQHIETQTEINSQQTETQTEVNSQHTETQTEVSLQEVAIQTEVNLQHAEAEIEIDSQRIDGLVSEDHRLREENGSLQDELKRKGEVMQGLKEEKERSDQKLVEANQAIAELEKQNSDLQGRSEEAKQRNAELEKQNADLQNNLGKSEQEAVGLEGQLEVAKAKEEELKSELMKSREELHQLQKRNYDLEDKLDQLERSNKEMNGDQEQLSEQVLDLQKKLSCSEEVTQELINKLKSAEAEKKEAEKRIEALKKQTSDSQDKLEKKERGSKIEINEICKELTQLKENLKRNEEEFKSVHEEKRKLEDKLKGVNTEKKESEDKLKEFEKEIDQAAYIMKEKEQSISNLKYQMLGLENEYKAQLESYEQEIGKLENMHDEFKEYVASILESMDREHEDKIKKLEENRDALSNIIAGKVLDIEGLTKELQDSKKEIEDLRNQVEMLSAETFADKQKGFNDQFYTLTGDISSDPDTAPLEKRNFTKSLSVDNELHVPPEEERKSLRSLSIDSGCNSDEENCDNHRCSSALTLTFISPIKEQAEIKM